jgi:hypothetical protein
VQLVEIDDGARAVGGDQALEHRLRELAARRGHLGEHGVGVDRERAGDPAHRDVARGRQHPARPVSRLPHLGRRELQERQRARRRRHVGEHAGSR